MLSQRRTFKLRDIKTRNGSDPRWHLPDREYTLLHTALWRSIQQPPLKVNRSRAR